MNRAQWLVGIISQAIWHTLCVIGVLKGAERKRSRVAEKGFEKNECFLKVVKNINLEIQEA